MSWLSYHSGEINFCFALACVLGITLVAVVGMSLVPGALVAAGVAAITVVALSTLQRGLISRNMRALCVQDHPEFGRVSAYRNHWSTNLHFFGSRRPSILTGDGRDGPTSEQESLWRTMLNNQDTLLRAAHEAFSSQITSIQPADLQLELIRLQTANEFTLFFTYGGWTKSNQSGFFVRYRNLALIQAGPTPWDGRDAW